MDEPDSDQILTIEELRSLRDRMGSEAAAPAPVASAAQFEIPDPPAGVPLEAPADPWEALRRRARGPRRWAGFRWARPLAAMGCVAAAGAGVGLLVFTGHPRSDPPPTVEVFTPVTSAPSVTTSAPASVPSPTEPSIVLPLPITPAPSPSADGPTEPPPASVPPPRATYRSNPPTSAKPPAARAPRAGAPEPGPPPAAAADPAGTPSPATEPPPTLTRTPTSWSPAAPG